MHDLKAYVALNRPIHDVGTAKLIVRHFIDAVELDHPLDPVVLCYVTQAVHRWLASGKHDLAKQLGIKRIVAGNPKSPGGKRRLSEGDREEIPLLFAERLQAVKGEKVIARGMSQRERIVHELALEYRVSARTIEYCLSEYAFDVAEARRLTKEVE